MSTQNITVGKYCSFCSGIKWAVKKLFEIKEQEEKNLYVFGDLIPNKQFINYLADSKIFTLNQIDECKDKVVIIPSHGVGPGTRVLIQKKAFKIIDLTCPNVLKIQKLAEFYSNQNYQVLICGNPKHPEVIGISEFAKNFLIIENADEALSLDFEDQAVLIAKSNFSYEEFDKIANILKSKKETLKIENALCLGTKNRLDELIQLSSENDLVLIVGGKNSSNSKALYKKALELNKADVWHIETVDELKDKDFLNYKNIAISSGASTPQWIIDDVSNFLADK